MSTAHEFKTITRKNMHNEWVVKTTVMLDEVKELSVTTTRGSSKELRSYAVVNLIENDCATHRIYTDFSKTYAATKPKRLTLALVEAQHNSLPLASIVADALEFYSLT